MSFAGDLYALLHSATVDGLVDERIYPSLAPEGAGRPYVVWRRNGGQGLPVMGATQSRGREIVDVFVGAYAETFDEADALSEALRDALNAGSNTQKPICTPPLDGFEPETKLFSVIFQVRVFYRG